MLFANVCAGFIRLCYGVSGERCCLETLGDPSGSAHLGVLALLIDPLVCVGPELRRRAYRWTRPSGGVRRRHCLRASLGVHQITGKCATIYDGIICSTGSCWKLLYMLVLVNCPVSMTIMHFW